jgi:hypothetical protein
MEHPPSPTPPVGTPPAEPVRVADDLWRDVAGPISNASMRLCSLRSRHEGHVALERELDELIAELDAAFRAAMRPAERRP